MILLITFIGFMFVTSIGKNYIDKGKTNLNIGENVDEITYTEGESQDNNSNFEEENENSYINEEYEISNFSDLSETEKFMNKVFIRAMKGYVRVNQILNMSRDESKNTKKEIMALENKKGKSMV